MARWEGWGRSEDVRKGGGAEGEALEESEKDVRIKESCFWGRMRMRRTVMMKARMEMMRMEMGNRWFLMEVIIPSSHTAFFLVVFISLLLRFVLTSFKILTPNLWLPPARYHTLSIAEVLIKYS